jgi:hypothetical protein
LTSAPPFFHWYASVPDPEAVTLKVAVWPATTCWSFGCDVMDGSVDLGVGLFALPEEPQELQTMKSATRPKHRAWLWAETGNERRAKLDVVILSLQGQEAL